MRTVKIERHAARLEMVWSTARPSDWQRLVFAVPAAMALTFFASAFSSRWFPDSLPIVAGAIVLALVGPQLDRLGRSIQVVAEPGLLRVTDRRFWKQTVTCEIASAEIHHVNAERIDGASHVHAWVGDNQERIVLVEGLDGRSEAQKIVAQVREFMELPVQAGTLPGQPREGVFDTPVVPPIRSVSNGAEQAELRTPAGPPDTVE